jgi:zinc transport system substrate-binding protein
VAQTAPLKVVVTIKPVHALALQVLDGVAVPTLVVGGAASPHTYALKPSDAKLFNDADVVVRVSEALEPFTTKVLKSIPKSVDVVTLEKAAGMTLLARRQSAMFEKHSHSAKGHKGHAHGPAAAAAAMDGHLWLDPANAKAIVAEIARVAAVKRPADADKIKANAAKASARIDALDGELAKTLAAAKDRPFVVFHDALQYFEVRYGLTPAGSIVVDPEVPPSAKRLTDVRSKIKALNAACVFSEPGYETKVVQSVIEGTSAKTGTLDPEGLLVDAGPDAYDALMRRLAQGFQSCLVPGS